jgi:hypothetical protein
MIIKALEKPWLNLWFFFFEIEGRQADAKAQEAVNHLTSFMSSREEISQPGIKPPTLRCGYLSTTIQEFKVVSNQILC